MVMRLAPRCQLPIGPPVAYLRYHYSP